MLSTYSEEITSLAEAKLTLLRGSSVRLYRAEKSGVSVLAAVPASRETSGALTQLRYEYDIRAELKLGFALRPVRFITHDDSPAMLLQDPCGEMLSNLLDVTMPVHQVLNLAVGISLALASAHARNLVHGGLTPGSIMIHPGRRRAWLTGFRSLTIDARNVSAVDGSVSHLGPDLLHYIAPEATGRVNRPVDCRTDLYSLGCVLYLLLTGRVPFPGLAPAEEIHAHIARWPPEHMEPSGAVAQRLVAILFRLMAKEPEERYQLAADVVADLLTCDAKGGSNGSSTRILHAKSLLGTSDVLLGRDGELESLRKAVHEASIGESARMILLEGPAGIGKTALIQHLRKQLREVPHEFAMGKLHSFMPDAIDVLRCLAVLAGPASAKALADAMQLSETNIRIRLCDAMDSQFVWAEDGRFTFSHDRFREAVLNGMTYRERLEGHLRVGRNLLESSANDELSVGAFAIVQQLNMAMPVVDGPDERRRIALLNLEAARLAKEATAYASARSYLSCARMFAQDADQRETIGALIELRLGECEFLTMEMSRAENRLSRLRVDLLNHKNKAELARLRVALHVALDQPKLALQVGLRYLAEETGIVLPLSPTDEEVDAEYLEFRTLYSDRSINDLVAAPLNQDENVRYAMDVLADLKPAALFTDLNLKDTVVLRMSSLSLKFGNCDASCYAYVCLSLVVGARYGDYRTASQFGELAMRLSPERGLSRFQGRVQMCYGTLNLPWTGPATVARQHIRESIRLTTQQGDLTFAIYSRRHLATNLLFCGAPLSDAQSTVEEGLVLARQANFAIVIDAFVAQAWFINAMRGAPVDLGISEDCPDYAALLENSLGGKFYRDIAAFAFWTYQLQVAYNFRDFETALRAEENANRIAWSSRSFLEIAEFNFYSALLRLAMARHSTVEEKEVHLRIANDRLSIVTKWSSNCPSNFLSREKLIQGELAYVENRILDAQSLYEAAIQLSTESDALHLQGLSCELAAHFCAAQRWHTAEQGYMKRAWNAYACWGADSMLRRIEQKFAYLKPTAETAVTPEHLVRGYQFDARAMLRAAQALSSEISLARLIHVLLENVQQYAGADRAVLCLLMDGILTVAAQATYSRSTADVRMERGVASPEILPTAIAYFTLRTQESLVLRDAREDPHYGVDVYIIERQPRSILCVPLVKQGKLLGLLYMENSLIAGIFTVDNVQMLEVLASQAAISLENVRLYEDLQTENLMRAATESNLRETQERLDKVAKLTAMGELVASIVHEVSQPLSAIGTCSRAALRWLNRETPDIGEVRGMLDQISADSMRAANIVTSLRAMTKRTAPRLDTLDVNEAIREVLGLVRGQLRNGGIVVRGNFDSGSLNVRGDRILLQQVLMNLVVNACEAMSDTGQREKVIEIKTRMDEENTLWVAVSDTGHGIAAESAPALFDSFFTTKDSGMGMGLSICKSIVEAHGGSIEAVSDVLGGACFQFSVPQSAGN